MHKMHKMHAKYKFSEGKKMHENAPPPLVTGKKRRDKGDDDQEGKVEVEVGPRS